MLAPYFNLTYFNFVLKASFSLLLILLVGDNECSAAASDNENISPGENCKWVHHADDNARHCFMLMAPSLLTTGHLIQVVRLLEGIYKAHVLII